MLIVKVIGPSGMERWLARGSLKCYPDNATLYHHPSSAKKARDNFLKKYAKQTWITQIYNIRDPETVLDI